MTALEGRKPTMIPNTDTENQGHKEDAGHAPGHMGSQQGQADSRLVPHQL